MDSFADRDSVATTEDVYRSVSGYDPRAKAEELARAGDTIDVWAQIGVAQLHGDSGATEEWAHETVASAYEQDARGWRERISRGEYVAGRSTDQAVAGELEETARRIRERR
ncbi:MAG TPA: hypothetical protein VLB73_01395, partial [Patescibacteria group bacterium]|nr:hypothetical protein [Patescibacteria group bacterium]